MTQEIDNIAGRQFKKARRKLSSAMNWSIGTFLLISLVTAGILLIIGGTVPNPLPTPPPAPEPTITPRLEAHIDLGDGNLAAAGSEVRRGLKVRNTGNTTETLHLKLDGYLPIKNVHLFPMQSSDGEPLPWRPPRSVDLGVFSPDEEKQYDLITYRRAPDYDVESPFLLQLLDVSNHLMDETFVAPDESVARVHTSVITPKSSIQQPGLVFPISIHSSASGIYELDCLNQVGKPVYSDECDVQPNSPITLSCPIEGGEPGLWSAKLYPGLSPHHPDINVTREQTALVTETFEVQPADYTLTISKTGKTLQQGTVTLRYVMTNTGNLAYGVDVRYEPITHALTTTLTVTSTRTLLHTLTFTGAEESRSLLPPEVSLEPAQNVFLEAEVLYDGLPLEFILELIPGSDQNHAISRREFIEQ